MQSSALAADDAHVVRPSVRAEQADPMSDRGEPGRHKIRLTGHLNTRWAA